MKWPELVPDKICTTPVTVQLESPGVNEDGSPKYGRTIQAMCNYSLKSKWSMDAERRLIKLQATALFNGDIAPEMEVLAGTVSVNGRVAWTIHAGSRARNPDSTVNYTCLELI